MIRKISHSFLISFGIFLFSFSLVLATDYYVSPSGNDSNLGTETQPFETINKAATKLHPGDTLYIREGTYVEAVRIETYNSGTATEPVRITAYPSETPTIDGQNTLGANYGVLLKILGDHVYVSGLEVKNSAGMCVLLYGKYNKVDHINAHHCNNQGILITGDYGIVEDSEVWWTASYNAYDPGGTWSSGLTAARNPHGAIIRRNYVHDNWGEGLSTYEATSTTIEDNIIRDSYSVNLYVSDTTDSLIQRNLVYTTPESEVQAGSRVGIMVADEKCKPCSGNNTIINNFVYRTRRNYYMGPGANSDGQPNTLIANNTFVDSTYQAGVRIHAGSFPGVKFINNIIVQSDSLDVIQNLEDEIEFSHNLWSKQPPGGSYLSVISPNDIIAYPLLTRGNQINPDYFKILTNSPAINQAQVLTQVTNDFFNNSRNTFPDMGAHEFIETSTTTIPGDANEDRVVDGIDYVIWLNNYQQEVIDEHLSGDFDGSGVVDGVDYVIWLNNYGT